jgi:hypothetical protein
MGGHRLYYAGFGQGQIVRSYEHFSELSGRIKRGELLR